MAKHGECVEIDGILTCPDVQKPMEADSSVANFIVLIAIIILAIWQSFKNKRNKI